MTSVKLYTKDVIAACIAYSASIGERIDREFEQEVQKLVKEPMKLFGFSFGGCSRIEAEEQVHYSIDYRFMVSSYKRCNNRVNDIRRACESSSCNMIDIDIDDLKLIMPFLNHAKISKY